MENRKIKIRYHHLMCIPRYRGKGYFVRIWKR